MYVKPGEILGNCIQNNYIFENYFHSWLMFKVIVRCCTEINIIAKNIIPKLILSNFKAFLVGIFRFRLTLCCQTWKGMGYEHTHIDCLVPN